MRVKLVLAGLLVAGGTGAALAWQAQPAPRMTAAAVPKVVPRDYPAVRALADSYVAQKRADGIVIAIGEGDVAPTFASAGTIAAGPGAAKAGPDSLWRVYSMTKPITAMAAMMLIEDGTLKLDQPISDFYPAFKSMTVLTSPDTSLETRPATKPITVRNLLTHTAGLGYSIVNTGPIKREYERQGIVPAALNPATEAQLRALRPKSLQAFAEKVATLPLVYEPGTRWSYSIGLDVMAAVVEKASGMRFEDFLHKRMFGPLKMTSTYWSVPASEAARFATNYAWVGDNRVPIDPGATSAFLQPPSFPYGGAGLVMSARDYDRFLHMLVNEGTLDGVRVMKPETVRLAMSNLLPPGVAFGGVGGGTGGAAAGAQGFGAGGSVYLVDVPGGASKGTYGWGGAAGTIAWVDPVRKVRGTVMVNYFPADKWPLRNDVVRALYADHRR